MNDEDTCRKLARPKLESSGWDGDKHFYNEQTSFTAGQIIGLARKTAVETFETEGHANDDARETEALMAGILDQVFIGDAA